jgi:hypothetical protein
MVLGTGQRADPVALALCEEGGETEGAGGTGRRSIGGTACTACGRCERVLGGGDLHAMEDVRSSRSSAEAEGVQSARETGTACTLTCVFRIEVRQ